MTKKIFLTKLRSKLEILEKQEIDDIIEEYSAHIDSKIEQGKTEKEAVADFGDIDVLTTEILSAYKIKSNPVHKEESKLEEFVSNFITEAGEFFKNLFETVSEQKMSRILLTIVYIIIAVIAVGILLWLVRIPFEIIKGIGFGFLSIGGHNVFSSGLGLVWNLFVELTCLVVSIVIIAALIKKAMIYFKDGENGVFEMKEDSKETVKTVKDGVKPIIEEVKDVVTNKKTEEAVTSFLVIIAKVAVVIFVYIPLLSVDLSLFITLGTLAFFAAQGIFSIGLSLILMGSLLIAMMLSVAITKFLFTKGGIK